MESKSNGNIPNLFVISVDGLNPNYIFGADKYALQIPNFRRFLTEGSYADVVKCVFPTLTYPGHAALITGVDSAKHGISNNIFDCPDEEHGNVWMWFSSDIKVPTLWGCATEAGLITASIDWPVSVGANINYNIPQYWRFKNFHDNKILEAMSTKGLLAEIEKAVGPYPPGDFSLEADLQKLKFSLYLIENKKPQFTTLYFASLDEDSHHYGPYTKEVFSTLEEIDRAIGVLMNTIKNVYGDQSIIAIVSDHGFVKTDQCININTMFEKSGLLEVDDSGKLSKWKVYATCKYGTAIVRFKDPKDIDSLIKCELILHDLLLHPSQCVEKIVERPSISETDGNPSAEFLVVANEGFHFENKFVGPLIDETPYKGQHGFLPEHPGMDASFFIMGQNISKGKNLGAIEMTDIAPTLANLMGFSFPSADGKNIL